MTFSIGKTNKQTLKKAKTKRTLQEQLTRVTYTTFTQGKEPFDQARCFSFSKFISKRQKMKRQLNNQNINSSGKAKLQRARRE